MCVKVMMVGEADTAALSAYPLINRRFLGTYS